MTDIVSPEKRSQMMAGIKGKNTKPEIKIRKGLFNFGFRYRLHDKVLPGKPDIVLPKYKAIVFVHGCFWHRHMCRLFKWPKSNTDFWQEKLNGNVLRDNKHYYELIKQGWRVLVIWECAVKGKNTNEFTKVILKISDWLKSCDNDIEISEEGVYEIPR